MLLICRDMVSKNEVGRLTPLILVSLRIFSDQDPNFLTMDCAGMWQNSWRKRFWSKGRKEKKKKRVCYSCAEEERRRKAQDSSTRLWYVTSGLSFVGGFSIKLSKKRVCYS